MIAAMARQHARAATSSELPAGASAPSEVLLLPAGDIPTRPHDGRAPWRNADADAVVAATRELSLDLPIDYEHQTERSAQNGQAAPAAGWIKRVFARDGAVWGAVEWTERAAAMIAAKEYRFISPTFISAKATRAVHRLTGAGLTNDPALYMRALAQANPEDHEEDQMDLEKLRKALGLPDDADEKAILAAATAAAGAQTAFAGVVKALGLAEDTAAASAAAAAGALVTGLKAVAKALGLAEDAEGSAIEAAATEAKAAASASAPDPAAFVPRSEFDRVSERLTALETTGAEDKATSAVAKAMRAGKLAPANRDWALAYAKKDPGGFADFVKDAPAVVAPGRRAMPAPSSGGDTLTEDELAVCRATGLSEKDFIASRKALAGETEETGNG